MPTIVISSAAPHDTAATEMEKQQKKQQHYIKYMWQRTEISYYWKYFTKAEDSA